MSPGTLEYVDLAMSHVDDAPTILLWYGLLSGLHPNNDVRNRFSGIGRRLLRDMMEPGSVTARPTCDIAVEELEVFSAKRRAFELLRQSLPANARVDLLPLVWTTIRPPGQSESQQLRLFEGDVDSTAIQEWVNEVGRVLQELNLSFSRGPIHADSREKKAKPKSKKRRKS